MSATLSATTSATAWPPVADRPIPASPTPAVTSWPARRVLAAVIVLAASVVSLLGAPQTTALAQAGDGNNESAGQDGAAGIRAERIDVALADPYVVVKVGDRHQPEGGGVSVPTLELHASMPSAGYGFEFVAAEWLDGQRLRVITRMTAPEPGTMHAQVVTPRMIRMQIPEANEGRHFIEVWLELTDGSMVPACATLVSFSKMVAVD